VAIGIFFGFTPLFGLKTALTVLFAWLTRSNIIAAVIASAAHDIILPLMPVVFRWSTSRLLVLSHPHHLPPSLTKMKWEGISLRGWIVFLLGWASLCYSADSSVRRLLPCSPTRSRGAWWPGTNRSDTPTSAATEIVS